MKNLTKILFACLCLGMVFASCNKDNFDWDAYYKEQAEKARLEKARIDGLLQTQAPLLKQYAETHFGENRKFSDSTNIWYEILAPGDDASYTYKATPGNYGYGVTAPSASVNFKGELLDGTVFDKSPDGSPSDYSTLNKAVEIYKMAWYYAFVPSSINIDGHDIKFNGLLPKGLKKGAKIRLVVPSYLGFDTTPYTKNGVTVPKDTPVAYTIEVTAIGAATSN